MTHAEAAQRLKIDLSVLELLVRGRLIVSRGGQINEADLRNAVGNNAFMAGVGRARQQAEQQRTNQLQAEHKAANKRAEILTRLRSAKESGDTATALSLSETLLQLEGVTN